MSQKTNAYGKGEDYIVALDAGGTMTDAILVKPDGTFTVGKSISRRDNQAKSYLSIKKSIRKKKTNLTFYNFE